jgi:hypothetical protein
MEYIIIAAVISSVILGSLSNWIYDLLKDSGVFPNRLSLKAIAIVLLGSLPFVFLVVFSQLPEQNRNDLINVLKETISVWKIWIIFIVVSAFWVLIEERRIKRLKKKIDELEINFEALRGTKTISSRLPTISDVFYNRVKKPPLEETIGKAANVWINAKNLNSTIVPHFELFEQKIRGGCNFRFIMIDPDSLACQLASENGLDGYRERLNSSLIGLRKLANDPLRKGHIELGLVNFIPPFSLVITDALTTKARMTVEFYGYKIGGRERVNVLCVKSTDNIWYQFYLKQFEEMWKDAKKYNFIKDDD